MTKQWPGNSILYGCGYSHCAPTDSLPSSGLECPICGRRYLRQDTLTHHLKQHEGATRCPCCNKTMANVFSLRRHLQCVHRVAAHDVRSMIPTRFRSVVENSLAVSAVGSVEKASRGLEGSASAEDVWSGVLVP